MKIFGKSNFRPQNLIFWLHHSKCLKKRVFKRFGASKISVSTMSEVNQSEGCVDNDHIQNLSGWIFNIMFSFWNIHFSMACMLSLMPKPLSFKLKNASKNSKKSWKIIFRKNLLDVSRWSRIGSEVSTWSQRMIFYPSNMLTSNFELQTKNHFL